MCPCLHLFEIANKDSTDTCMFTAHNLIPGSTVEVSTPVCLQFSVLGQYHKMQLCKRYGEHNGTTYLPILKMHSMAVKIEFSECIYVETTLLQCVISHWRRRNRKNCKHAGNLRFALSHAPIYIKTQMLAWISSVLLEPSWKHFIQHLSWVAEWKTHTVEKMNKLIFLMVSFSSCVIIF